MSIAEKLADAKQAGERLREVRDGAIEECLGAVADLESALVRALDGEKLRGLPELAPDFRAMRIRGARYDEPLREHDKHALVLGRDGRLAMAWVFRSDSGAQVASWQEAGDDDLLAEDVEGFARAAERALDAHVEGLKKTARRFEELRELARRLRAAMGA